MSLNGIDLSRFSGRDELLEEVKRFRSFIPMIYRTDDLIHSRRTSLMGYDISEPIRAAYKTREEDEENGVDVDKVHALLPVHDDAEILTDDVELHAKRTMSEEEKAGHEQDEIAAIEKLALIWPYDVNGYNYSELLYNAMHKDCIEAQIGSYIDKLDGFCEALHELRAGNIQFSIHNTRNEEVENGYKKNPVKTYIDILAGFTDEYPALAKLLPGNHPLLKPFDDLVGLDLDKILFNGKPHTVDSIQQPTGIPHYDRWVQLTIEHFGISPLVEQKEQYKGHVPSTQQ